MEASLFETPIRSRGGLPWREGGRHEGFTPSILEVATGLPDPLITTTFRWKLIEKRKKGLKRAEANEMWVVEEAANSPSPM